MLSCLQCQKFSSPHLHGMSRCQRKTASLQRRVSFSNDERESNSTLLTATMRPGMELGPGMKVGSLSFVPDILRSAQQNQIGSQSTKENLENEANATLFIKELLLEIKKSDEEEPLGKPISPIIAILKGKYQVLKPKKRREQLLAVLTYYNVEDVIDQQSGDGQTALHLTVAAHDYSSAMILVAFGANVNIVDNRGYTPLDLLMTNPIELETVVCITSKSDAFTPQIHSPDFTVSYEERRKLVELLTSTGAVRGETVEKLTMIKSVPPFPCVPSVDSDSEKDEEIWLMWEYKLTSRYSQLRNEIEMLLCKEELSHKETFSLGVHQREIQVLKRAGSRVLFLDGGGIRGLLQIEILSQLERKTGRRVTELFDWIVGTSTGGIIALCLVYGKKTLPQLRQLYFKLKDEVFGKVRAGVATEVRKYEEILKKEFSTEEGEQLHMDHITYPRVMIAAVDKTHTNLKLEFFNNCFNDRYHKHNGKPWPVWEVARYTSAAPLLFGEFNNFVDGGVLANNPSESGLTRIEQYYRRSGLLKLPISLVVSVGSGLVPVKDLGSINAQDILFFGAKGWLDSTAHVRDRAINLKTLLLNAISETETAVENCRSRCTEQGIPFFRLNLILEKVVSSQETNPDLLLSMMLKATKDSNQLTELKDLITCLHTLSNACSKAQHTLMSSLH